MNSIFVLSQEKGRLHLDIFPPTTHLIEEAPIHLDKSITELEEMLDVIRDHVLNPVCQCEAPDHKKNGM